MWMHTPGPTTASPCGGRGQHLALVSLHPLPHWPRQQWTNCLSGLLSTTPPSLLHSTFWWLLHYRRLTSLGELPSLPRSCSMTHATGGIRRCSPTCNSSSNSWPLGQRRPKPSSCRAHQELITSCLQWLSTLQETLAGLLTLPSESRWCQP